MHWVSWKMMGLPKRGFGDSGKQIWRLLHNPNNLVAKLPKGGYFPTTNVVEAGQGYKQGLRCLVGDGSDIKAFSLDTHPQLLEGLETEIQTVNSSLLDQNHGITI